jgi:anti-sigma-K factor RskA
MSNHEKFEELIPIYALEALDGEELRELQKHLGTGCKACEELLREQERIKSFLPYSVMTPSPSPRVKDRLFKKIKSSQDFERNVYSPSLWDRLQPMWLRLGGAVALAALVLLILSNLSLMNRLKDQQMEISRLQDKITNQTGSIESLSTSLASREAEITGLKEQLDQQTQITKLLENPNVVVINMVGLKPDLKAHGRVLWNTKENKAFVHVLNLPALPSGKTYQLWVIADSTPRSAGIFKVGESGENFMNLESLPDPSKIKTFAVTLEPDGGVPLPTGEMYLLGES